MHAKEMVGTHPSIRGNVSDTLILCIEQCYDCAQACTACADACLGEEAVGELVQCISLNLDCADVCLATGTVATRQTGSNEQYIRSMLQACETAVRLCAEECEGHAQDHDHCRICAEACRSCEDACRKAGQSMTH